ncbi:unnamed protein product [Victoria cruziana]
MLDLLIGQHRSDIAY